MNEQKIIEHHIQKHIMAVLYRQKYARFRDLRKKGVDTNLFSYHLKLLVTQGVVEKSEQGYSLGQAGLMYVDRLSEGSMTPRRQPKIVTMLVVQNENGDVLLWRRNKQPYIDTWTLPYGKIHLEDGSIQMAATREAREKLHLKNVAPEHAGDCYIRVRGTEGEILSLTLAHVFRLFTKDIVQNEHVAWVQPHKLANYGLAPAVERIVARTFFRDSHFFEEYEEAWYDNSVSQR